MNCKLRILEYVKCIKIVLALSIVLFMLVLSYWHQDFFHVMLVILLLSNLLLITNVLQLPTNLQ